MVAADGPSAAIGAVSGAGCSVCTRDVRPRTWRTAGPVHRSVNGSPVLVFVYGWKWLARQTWRQTPSSCSSSSQAFLSASFSRSGDAVTSLTSF